MCNNYKASSLFKWINRNHHAKFNFDNIPRINNQSYPLQSNQPIEPFCYKATNLILF